MASITDRIEKQALLDAPLERVWQAISDSREFGSWFGMRLDGPFVAGARIGGEIVPTTVDPDVAAAQKPYEGQRFDIMVERVEPMRLLAFRWHPGVPDPNADLSKEPTTLVVFELEERPDGTLLTITESGFDGIPLARRAEALEGNAEGWEAQLMLIGKYLARAA
ncbi:MAG TPA: SRPBCC family protein [Gemmatimonadaceae bacterium]|nr:SRPBCC family protein [Gemmatimonadaceae bacterium]